MPVRLERLILSQSALRQLTVSNASPVFIAMAPIPPVRQDNVTQGTGAPLVLSQLPRLVKHTATDVHLEHIALREANNRESVLLESTVPRLRPEQDLPQSQETARKAITAHLVLAPMKRTTVPTATIVQQEVTAR